MTNEFKQIVKDEFKISPIMKWIIGIVFMAGIAYANILKIPSMQKEIKDNTKNISEVQGDIKEIKTNIGWLKEWAKKR